MGLIVNVKESHEAPGLVGAGNDYLEGQGEVVHRFVMVLRGVLTWHITITQLCIYSKWTPPTLQ